jgi:Phd_YefM.
MKLHPQVIEKEGRKEFVVLPYEEFLALEELMHDYEDLKDIREAKEESIGQPGVPLEQVVRELGL